MKVLHGLTGAAGQPFMLSRSLRKIGVKADNVLIGHNRFGYESDHIIEVSDNPFMAASGFLKQHAGEYDIFHLHFRPFFYAHPSHLAFPTFADLLCLKAAGKRIVFHFRGSEIRLHSEFAAKSPYNYVREDPHNLISKFPEETMLRYREMVRTLADEVLVSDEELLSYVPGATIVPRAMDLDRLSFVGPVNQKKPLIIHAPSRPQVKGSRHVRQAIEKLKDKGLEFDYRQVEGLSHKEALDLYKKADIIIDQLRIGWYGVLSVEAMALGKAVVCYIRDDLKQHLPAPPPLLSATPDDLDRRLEELILSPSSREELGKAGRAWVEEHHDCQKIALQLKDIYSRILQEPKPLDLVPALDFIEHQKAFMDEQIFASRRGICGMVKSLIHNSRLFVHHAKNHGWNYAMELATKKIRGKFNAQRRRR